MQTPLSLPTGRGLGRPPRQYMGYYGTVNKLAVCILLEYILVSYQFLPTSPTTKCYFYSIEHLTLYRLVWRPGWTGLSQTPGTRVELPVLCAARIPGQFIGFIKQQLLLQWWIQNLPDWGGPLTLGEKVIIWSDFCRKLDENENKLDREGA